MTKVVNLRDGTDQSLPARQDGMIEMLEKAIEEVKSGRIVGLAIAGATTDNQSYTVWCAHGCGVAVLGAAARLQSELSRSDG